MVPHETYEKVFTALLLQEGALDAIGKIIYPMVSRIITEARQAQHEATWAMAKQECWKVLQERVDTYLAKHNNENPTLQTANELRWGIEVLYFAQDCLSSLPCPPLTTNEK
jgi:hypothetical protein